MVIQSPLFKLSLSMRMPSILKCTLCTKQFSALMFIMGPRPYPPILIPPSLSPHPYPPVLIPPSLSSRPYPPILIPPSLSPRPYPPILIPRPYPPILIPPSFFGTLGMKAFGSLLGKYWCDCLFCYHFLYLLRDGPCIPRIDY